nr:hypothetical protein CFP56_58989 [Quercus suber]
MTTFFLKGTKKVTTDRGVQPSKTPLKRKITRDLQWSHQKWQYSRGKNTSEGKIFSVLSEYFITLTVGGPLSSKWEEEKLLSSLQGNFCKPNYSVIKTSASPKLLCVKSLKVFCITKTYLCVKSQKNQNLSLCQVSKGLLHHQNFFLCQVSKACVGSVQESGRSKRIEMETAAVHPGHPFTVHTQAYRRWCTATFERLFWGACSNGRISACDKP